MSPLFFWKLIFFKKFGGSKHKNFGDGKAAGGSGMDKLRMLTKSTYSVVSLDGYKSSFLERAFKAFQKNKDNENFVIIGHPKSMSEYSLKKLDNFIIKNNEHKFRTVRDFQNEF
ncbi:MAG: Putative xylanase/chitin deacetylase [uncultured Sulfurovum sp.]|uniref:Xylanase/chitin deacetylase n=1 Tax=uncultured Sulfurovum sp. TaxID=269237 RepID=A0A6S6SMY7_9BACT|nr:MAG: Putative xylanase/chitin deacetylase [uncultured Sulfurovum sp.]